MADHHGVPSHYDVGDREADQQYRDTPPGAGYEHTDAAVGIIVKFMAWLLVAAVVIHLGVWGMFELFVEQRRETFEPQFPMAVGLGDRLPPQPRLQQFPHMEYLEFRDWEDGMLHRYGWVNQAEGIVRIPIEDAMRIVVERGLPSRVSVDADPMDVPGMMPSDSSSGRMLEQRR